MATISATFLNDYGQSRKWVIVDSGRDPNSPPVIFNDYLDPNQATDSLSLYSDDGIYGQVTYQRSDGAPTVADNITDGTQVRMS
jgi:hypothetical protein